MILIISTKIDPHVDAVVEFLKRGSVPFQRLELEAAGVDFEIELAPAHVGVAWSLTDRHSGQAVHSSEVRTVWWRRGTMFPLGAPAVTESTVEVEECRVVVKWAVESLPQGIFPLGHPWNLRKAENKIQQLASAARLGFQVPRYVFSNSAIRLANFADDLPSVVIKSLNQSSVIIDGVERSFYAAKLTGRAARDELKSHQSAACFIQEEIVRKADLRVFVTPSRAFAVRISVAELPDTEIDWRPHVEACAHTPFEINADLEAMMRAFLVDIGIPSGHFDFILDESSGAVWFLECNPNGQWYWLERRAGLDIAANIHKTLIDHHGGH